MIRRSHMAWWSFLLAFSSTAAAADFEVGQTVFWKDGAKAMVGAREVDAESIPWPTTVKEVLKDWLLLGPAWVHQDDVQTADQVVEFYTEEIGREPTARSYRRRALAWQSKEKYDSAIDDFSKAIEIDPDDKFNYHNRGNARYAMKNYALAINDFTEALRIDPRFLLSLYRRASAHAEVGDHDEALRDFGELLRIDPNNANLYLQRGVALSRKGDYVAALKDFNRLKELSPKSPVSYNTIAWLLATSPVDSIRNGKSAVEHATRACELSEWKAAGYLDTLAAAYAESGDFKKAEEWLNKAIELLASDEEKADYGTRLALYKSGKPFRDAPK